MSTRILITSDMHTGHRAGLIPPKYYGGGREWIKKQEEKWEWFIDTLKEIGKIDCLVDLGDIVDGQGIKDSTETILDPNKQIMSAVEIIETIGAPVNWFVHGTRVHTTTRDGLEIDLAVASYVNGNDNPKISGQLWLGYGDFILDFRHACSGKSMIKHTRANPLLRERYHNESEFLEGRQPLATHYFRGHSHYMFSAGEPNRWSGYSVPALQSAKTKYGRILSSVTHVGMGVLTINKGWPEWKVYEPKRKKAKVLDLLPKNRKKS